MARNPAMEFGVIFDWDGVVIDSSALHARSWELLAEEENRTLPVDHFKEGFGRKNSYIIPKILKWAEDSAEVERLSSRKEALYRDLVRKEGVVALPGVSVLLKNLQDAGVPCCVGSSTERANIELALEVLVLRSFFADIVSAEDVTEGKPHPDVFLKAAACLDLSPNACVVIEDAHVGIEAARAGGMFVLAVATTHPLESLSNADRAVPTLEAVTPSDFELLVAQGAI